MIHHLGQAFGASAEISVFISQVCLLTNHTDDAAPLHDALADAGVEYGGFEAWVTADQHDGIGLFDTGN